MDSTLYLHQSRRLAKLIKHLIGSSHWTNYYAWEYHFNNIELNLLYTNDWSEKRFTFISRFSREVLLSTDSIKEAIKFILTNKN